MLKSNHEYTVAKLEEAVDTEYHRAITDGSKKVRDWAVDANYRVYNADDSRVRPAVYAAFQDVIGRFSPDRLVPRVRSDK